MRAVPQTTLSVACSRPPARSRSQGCGQDEPREPHRAAPARSRYGDDPSQFGELTLPEGTPRGVVVVIHGGFWKAEYDLSLGRPLAAEPGRARAGRSGTSSTAASARRGRGRRGAADLRRRRCRHRPARRRRRPRHLGACSPWATPPAATSRPGPPGAPDARVPVTGVVSQAGVLDLVRRRPARPRRRRGPGAARPPARPGRRAVRPAPAAAARRPGALRARHRRHDRPDRPVAAATSRRRQRPAPTPTLTEVEGDHFVVIDPDSDAWEQTLRLLDDLV